MKEEVEKLEEPEEDLEIIMSEDQEEPAIDIKQNKNTRYIGYKTRVIIYIIIIIISSIISTTCFAKSFVIDQEEYVNYKESSNVDYQVNLKKNSFYDQPYLGKDMLYIASLINNIDINYLYDFTISEPIDLTFSYDIMARLEIVDPVDNKVYFEKEYILLDNEVEKIENQQKLSLNKKINIDYNYYNSLANSFKSTYGVDSKSNLIVYLRINKQNTNNTDEIKINKENEMSLTIPLSEKAINIKMDYKKINTYKQILKEKTVKLNNIISTLLAIVFFVIAIKAIYKLVKIIPVFHQRKNKYDLYTKKILTEYDRMIVESSYCPELEKYNIIKIKKFEELIDVHDNLKQPILFYEVAKHQKAYFYIKNQKDIYLTVIKDVDLEARNEKK